MSEHNTPPTVLQMHEVAITYKRPLFDSMPVIGCSQDASDLLKKLSNPQTLDYKEHFWVLFLNQSSKVLGFSEVGVGDDTGTAVNKKEVFQLALLLHAKSIIIAHNHPSGGLEPSQADIELTKHIQEITKIFSMHMLDHLILTSEGYYSFADNFML